MRIAALLRSNGWVLNLVFIALGAYFVAGAVNAVVARSIRVVPTAGDRNAMPGGPLVPVRQSFGAIAERNLFGVKREVLNPELGQPGGEPMLVSGRNYDPNSLKPCSLNANIRATLVAENAPEWSMAVLFVNNEAGVYSVNDGSNRIQDDAVLVDVLDRSIVVRRRDHFERCNADLEGQPTMTTMAPVAPPPPAGDTGPTPGDMTGVTKISDTQYKVDRTEVDRALNNLAQVSTEARIVPSFKNGVANGFKMFSIKPGSIFSKIGLQNGDVIRKINGYEMNSPDKALELYQKLKDTPSVQIETERRGQSMTINYAIGG